MQFHDALSILMDNPGNTKMYNAGWKPGETVEICSPSAEDAINIPYLCFTGIGCRAPWVPTQPDMLLDDWAVFYHGDETIT